MSGPEIVTAVLRRNGRVLLCRRSARREAFPNLWAFPGGHVEAGEAAEAALVRELAEELGIAVARPSGSPVVVVATAAFRLRIWLIEAWTGTPANAAPEEHDDLVWADLDQARSLDLAHPEHYLPLLAELLAEPRETVVNDSGSDGLTGEPVQDVVGHFAPAVVEHRPLGTARSAGARP